MLDRHQRAEQIEARLRAALSPQRLTLIDESDQHAGHAGAAGGASHFRLHLVSARFEGLGAVARHRLVYDSLRDLLERDIHALAMTLHTPSEAQGTAAPNLPGTSTS